jgi:hypothetical protein
MKKKKRKTRENKGKEQQQKIKKIKIAKGIIISSTLGAFNYRYLQATVL